MSFLKRLMAGILPEQEPKAVSKVPGFSVSLEKKDGVLLTFKPEDETNTEKKDASVDYYYEVSVDVDGSNPEYPAEDKPWKHTYTVALESDSGQGLTGGTSYISQGARWTGFELVEEFDDAKNLPMGKRMPPHHTVMLRSHFRDANGHDTSMAIGSWIRKSERETPQWEAAVRSPVIWM